MEMAAFLPWAMDSIIVPGPVTASPPAKTPFRFVSRVTGSARMVPHRVPFNPLKALRIESAPAIPVAMKNGVKALQKGIGRGLAHPGIEMNFDPHLFDDGEILFDHLFGQAIGGKSIRQETAHLVLGLKKGDRIALPPQIVGCHESGRT